MGRQHPCLQEVFQIQSKHRAKVEPLLSVKDTAYGYRIRFVSPGLCVSNSFHEVLQQSPSP